MTDKNKLIKINAELDKLVDQSNEVADKVGQLSSTRDSLLIEIIETENLLKDSNWELKFSGQIFLEYAGKVDDYIMSTILSYAKSSGSSYQYVWLQLESGIQFRIDEDEVSLHFDEPKMILPFVKKHKVKITGSSVVDRLRNLKREVASIEQICHEFSLKE